MTAQISKSEQDEREMCIRDRLMVVNKIDRTKNDMVMDMPFVYVGS